MSTRSAEEQRTLEAALTLWSEKGYANSSMRELSRRLGIGISALYERFASKEHLVFFLYRQLNQQSLEMYQSGRVKGDDQIGPNFRSFVRCKLEVMEPHREAITAIFREAVDPASSLSPLGQKASELREANLAALQDLLRAGGIKDDEECNRLSRLVWILHLGVMYYWLHDRSEGSRNTQSLIDKLADLSALLPLLKMVPDAESWIDLLQHVMHESPDDASEVVQPTPESDPLVHYDVVVIGGGPIGMLYATWLKMQRPNTSILVLDRNAQAVHKIGESTLSGFCKAARSVGISHEVMQRLFYPKNGLGFFHVNSATRDLPAAEEYILETFDETFQVERRVMDQLLIDNGKRKGVSIIQGATVDIRNSSLQSPRSEVTFSVGSQQFRIASTIVVDASGPARVVGRHAQQYAEERVDFQTSAVWGYFKNVRSLDSYDWSKVAQFPRDEYTQHVCFPEGWMWYIPLVSWQDSPDANLQQMLSYVLQSNNTLPDRHQLMSRFGCPASDIVSVGMVLRQDRDNHLRNDPREAFEIYRQRYPAINHLLSGAELLTGHYEPDTSFSSRAGFRRHARQVAGDGWLLVGDAAFFVDPLISPGLTAGSAMAFRAVDATIRTLDEPDQMVSAFADYDEYTHQLHDALERDNQLVYMSFNHPKALELVQRFQEIDARKHFVEHQGDDYSMADTNVWGILDERYQIIQRELHAIMSASEHDVGVQVPVQEQSAADYEPMVAKMRQFLQSHLEEFASLTPYVRQNSIIDTEPL